MDERSELCELHRLKDATPLATVAQVLEARGIEADVWPENDKHLIPWSSGTWRLMVRCRDVVYARWVAAAVGLDTWPDEAAGEPG